MSGASIGSLFSGYGGLDMGVQAVLGGDLAWVADIDPGACAILAHHHPGVPNLGDITAVKWTPDCPRCGHELRAVNETPGTDGYIYWCPACRGEFPVSIRPDDMPAPVDVLTGGTPCQDLSHAGRRAGMTEGTRSNLWVAMREAIAQLRPGLVIWENVRGAYSAAADSELVARPGLLDSVRRRDDREPVLRALGRVLGDLSDLGYDAVWHGLRAADVGAPHSRFRVFVTAWPASPHAQRSGRGAAWHPASGEAFGGWASAVAGRPSGAPAHLTLLPTPKARDWKGDAPASAARNAPDLSAIGSLLPTPTAADSKASGGSSVHDVTLTDAVVRTNLGEKENPRHARTPEARSAEELRDMWEAAGSQEVRERSPGGQDCLHEAQELLAGMREHPRDGDEGCSALASQEAQGHGMPRLRHDCEPACSPRGPEPGQQRPIQPHDALRELSSEVALAGRSSGVEWGPYSQAIRRWELILGRLAPLPTQLSQKGRPQLSPGFVEFLMGLPAGHVTDPGIYADTTDRRGKPLSASAIRNLQLRALGNGVVPQQAAAAVRWGLAHAHLEVSA